MDKMLESYWGLLNSIKLESKQEQIISISIITLTIHYITNIKRLVTPTETLSTAIEQLNITFADVPVNQIKFDSNLKKYYKDVIVNFFKIVDPTIKFNRREKFENFIKNAQIAITDYLVSLRKTNKSIIDSAIDIVDEVKSNLNQHSREDFFNNEFIPYLKNNRELLKNSLTLYVPYITMTETSIKEDSDDYHFFAEGLFALANLYMADLVLLYEQNKLTLAEIIGSIYDLMILINSHLKNDKSSLSDRKL